MTQTRYVNTGSSAGGDGTTNNTTGSTRAYASLSAAEAALPATLTEAYIINCCGTTADATALTFSGTNVSSYSITVQGNTGDSAGRHAGVWSTSKYRLSNATDYQGGITVAEAGVKILGIQIENTAAQGNYPFSQDATSCTTVVDGCLIRVTTAKTGFGVGCNVSGGTCSIRNSVVIAKDTGIYCGYGSGAPTLTVYNCTVTGATTGVNRDGGGTCTVENTYVGNCTTEYSGTMTLTTCAHSSSTSYTGSTASIAHSTANFTNVTGGSEDYHLKSDASATLLTGGTDLSATFTTDIDGDTRVDWGIGADEYIAAAVAGQPTIKRLGGVAFSALNRGVW